MDTNTLIELAAKAVEVIGMIEENREREREGISREYGEAAFRYIAEEIRKMAIPCDKIVEEYDADSRTITTWVLPEAGHSSFTSEENMKYD